MSYNSSIKDGKFYLDYGKEDVDGSIRIEVDTEMDMGCIEKRIDGLWHPASFETGPNSMWVGRNVGIAGIGHHLTTEAMETHSHFHAHSMYDGETTITDTQMLNIYNYTERLVFQPDDSGSWTGTTYEFISPAPTHSIVGKGYLQTDTTAATQPVRIRTWAGTDDTGFLIFDQTYPASNFPASSEINIEYAGYLEFEAGNNYFTRYSSDSDFSLKTNAGGTFPWVAADFSDAREENLLQTMGWEDGYDYSLNQYLIYERQIYICNTAGVQTGTWESNSALWDELSGEVTDIWSRTGTDVYLNNLGDKVGIGTNDPTNKLEVNLGGANQQGAISLLSGGSGNFVSYGLGRTEREFDIAIAVTNNNWVTGSTPGDVVLFTHSNDLFLNTFSGGDPLIKLQDSNNRVGIGTTSPSQKLDVGGNIGLTGDIKMSAGGLLDFIDETGSKIWLHGAENYVIGVESSELRLSAGTNAMTTFYTGGYSGSEVARIESDGMMKVTGGVRAPEFWSSGLLKIQPDVQGDVELFGDTNVANDSNGKIFKVWRKASEGNSYLRFYGLANEGMMIHSSDKLTLQGQVSFTINSVTDDIFFKVGDNAGNKKVYFRDSDGTNVASIDSDGNLNCNELNTDNGATISKGLEVGEGLTVLTDGADITGDVEIDGSLGIGTDNFEYILNLLSTDPIIKLESSRTIMGSGYNVGALVFSAGELGHSEVAQIRIDASEDWTDTSSPTEISFHLTAVDAIQATTNVMRMNAIGVAIHRDHDIQLPLEVESADDNQIMCIDSTAQAEGVGGGIAFGAHYTDADDEAMVARIEAEKANSTSGHMGFNLAIESTDDGGTLAERMKFTFDGKCGINVTPFSSPTKTLDVFGDTRIRGDLTVDDNIIVGGTVDGVDIANDLAPLNSPSFIGGVTISGDLTVDTDTLYVDSTDNRVGIGTTDPKEELHIKSDHPTITFEEADAGSNEKVWEFGAAGEEFLFRTANDSHTGNQTIFKAIDRGGTSVGTFIIPNAKVGIGTSTISGELTIDQSNASGEIPVLTLDQGDVDQHFIEFLNGTVYTSKNGQDEYLKVKVGGNTRYLRLFN